MKRIKVVITGLNIVSSLGLNLEENWENIVAGRSGVRTITLFDPSHNETRIAAQVPDIDVIVSGRNLDLPEALVLEPNGTLLIHADRATPQGRVARRCA